MIKTFLLLTILIFPGKISTADETENDQNNKLAITLYNYEDLFYYGKIYVGSNDQELNVVFSTGVSVIWLPGISCTACTNENKFNTDTISYKNLTTYKTFNSSVWSVKGYLSTETFRVLPETIEIHHIKFLLVEENNQSLNINLDGLVGLGLNNVDLDLTQEPFDYSNLVYQFYKQGVIHSPRFSFYLSRGRHSNSPSKLFIGDFSKGTSLSPLYKQMSFCEVDKSLKQWGCELDRVDIRINQVKLNSKILFDTGVSKLIVPVSDYKKLKKYLIDETNSDCILSESHQLLCKCSSSGQFPEMKLYVNGSPIVIYTKEMIKYFPEEAYQCRFEIVVDMENYENWILGSVAMRNILFSFDFAGKRIGFVQNPKDIQFYLDQDNSSDDENSGSNLRLVYIFAFVLLLILMYWLYKYASKGESDPENSRKFRNTFNENEYDYDGLKGNANIKSEENIEMKVIQ